MDKTPFQRGFIFCSFFKLFPVGHLNLKIKGKMSTGATTLLDVAREAQVSLGASNPQLFFKSMIDNFSSDFSDSGEGNDSNGFAEKAQPLG